MHQFPLLLMAVLALTGCHKTFYQRKDAIEACRKTPAVSAAVITGRASAPANVLAMKKCMDSRGYVLVPGASTCGLKPHTPLQWIWPSNYYPGCYRSKNPDIRRIEDAEPPPSRGNWP